MVVVVDGNQVAELKVTGHGGGLGGDTLHGAAITEEHVGVVVEQLEAGLVVDTTGVGLSHSETNSVSKTLAERSSGDLNTGGVVSLGVTGGDAVNLLRKSVEAYHVWLECTYTELLQVVHGQGVAEEVEQSILEHAAVSVAMEVALVVVRKLLPPVSRKGLRGTLRAVFR